MSSTKPTTYFIPVLGSFYPKLEDVAYALVRAITGAALVVHGFGKIQNPTGAAGMVESIGLFPGPAAWWSVALSCTEFFGGILLVLGLLTRPAAAAAAFVLATTIYVHGLVWAQGWDGAEKSILWTAILLFLVVQGGGRLSADRLIGKEV